MDRFIFRGILKERPVLVIPCISPDWFQDERTSRKEVIHNIVITSQMSHIKNVLKLFGCCLEFKHPAMVYEYAGTKILSHVLENPIDRESLFWSNRLKIAKDIAIVILHLHTDFPTPIIYRDLTLSNVVIDQVGEAKLIDFSYSISLPPGESKVEDPPIGTFGYMDPEYLSSGYVTQKIDVYSLGVLMLELFTGKSAMFRFEEDMFLNDYFQSCLEKDQLNCIVDPYILKDESNNAKRQEMLAFLDLALRCTKREGKNRPDMIDVAKELSQIEKNGSRL